MDLLNTIESALQQVVGFLWGPPMVVLLVGGGLFFLLFSRGLPYRYIGSGARLLFHRSDADDPGQLSHYQSLSTALSGTLGMGNVAGVALAITMGGPGAIFWMWLSALLGIATKFYTCSLAVMYRGRDSAGEWQGGPMYVIREGLGEKWHWLAAFFAIAGLLGTMPIFQVNQLVQIIRITVAEPLGWASSSAHFGFDLFFGIALALVVMFVALGQLPRLGRVTGLLVPLMVAGYLLFTFTILLFNWQQVPSAFALILHDAFTAQAVGGGAVGALIITGIRRAAFSNEAGIGTESMAHGAARTREPIREGLVAMLGPIVDTLIVCTCTALVIIIAGVWDNPQLDGIALTTAAFDRLVPGGGGLILALLVSVLSISTVLTFWYYGAKCLSFLIGARYQQHYIWIYMLLIIVGAVSSLSVIVALIDSMYALMAIPTMTSTLLLAPKVNAAAKRYFAAKASKLA